jgi:hypothetical protein
MIPMKLMEGCAKREVTSRQFGQQDDVDCGVAGAIGLRAARLDPGAPMKMLNYMCGGRNHVCE